MQVLIFFGPEPTNTNIFPPRFKFIEILSISADGDKKLAVNWTDKISQLNIGMISNAAQTRGHFDFFCLK